MIYETYPFAKPPLPYEYEALEPYIDAQAMHYHYDKHFENYIKGLNAALKPYPQLQKMTLLELLSNSRILPPEARTAILNNGGGVYNHSLYFNNLSPASENNHIPKEALMKQINQSFGSFEVFKEAFSKKALSVFGSGWTYFGKNLYGDLEIINVPNQNTLVAQNFQPIILVDVWEHAYYLQYKNLRADYINNIWNILKF